jgi:hypothetical protein
MEHPRVANQVLSNESQAIPAIQVLSRKTHLTQHPELWVIESLTGCLRGAEHWAVIASLIETCKLNSVDPYAYLTATITKIVNGHPNARLDELLPLAYPTAALREVA